MIDLWLNSIVLINANILIEKWLSVISVISGSDRLFFQKIQLFCHLESLLRIDICQ